MEWYTTWKRENVVPEERKVKQIQKWKVVTALLQVWW